MLKKPNLLKCVKDGGFRSYKFGDSSRNVCLPLPQSIGSPGLAREILPVNRLVLHQRARCSLRTTGRAPHKFGFCFTCHWRPSCAN